MPSGIYIRSEQAINNMSNSAKGKIISESTKIKMREAQLGEKHHMYQKHPSLITREKQRRSHIGISPSQITRDKIGNSIRGENHPFFGITGSKHPCWTGGSSLIKQIRNCNEYKVWYKNIFGRDKYTCQKCNKINIYLEAHHIKQLTEIIYEYNITSLDQALSCPDLWDLNNGITLCKECHKKIKIKRRFKRRN